jgi:ketopantoate reductase
MGIVLNWSYDQKNSYTNLLQYSHADKSFCCLLSEGVGESTGWKSGIRNYSGVVMKILVYGAGPLGSIFAAKLHDGGHDVSILARGQRLEDLRQHGIVLENAYTGEQSTTRLTVVEALHPDDTYDLILVIMRKNHAVEILPTLAENKHTPSVMFMMNNAAGPGELVDALGKERVMMGFPLPGGERDGHVMRVIPDNRWMPWRIPIGEVDGSITSRTRVVADALAQMPGYRVEVRQDMDAWLKYHVALLMPGFVPMLLACENDIERMSRTRDALVLAVRATKEAFRALQHAGVPFSPSGFGIYPWIPEPVLVWAWSKIARLPILKISGEGHAEAARDEMEFLTREFLDVVKAAGAQTPLIDQLFEHYKPHTPPIPDGSRKIPLRKHGLWVMALAAAAILTAFFMLGRRR